MPAAAHVGGADDDDDDEPVELLSGARPSGSMPSASRTLTGNILPLPVVRRGTVRWLALP